MENASKALIIAGGILLAVMIVSMGVLVANSGSSLAHRYSETVDATNISNFNQKILSYARNLNAQDMVTLINLIEELNLKYKYSNERKISLLWTTGSSINWDEETMIAEMENTNAQNDPIYEFKSVSYYDSGYIKEIRFKK